MELQDVSIDAPAGAGAGSSGSAVISASQAPYTRSTGDADGSMALAGGNNGRYGADSSTTRVKVLLAVLACGALVCWVAALAMLAGKPLATYSVIAPPSADSADSRDYRVVFLENGLEVLLVSDPETKVSAAAVDVKVGSWADPPEYQGLAHFLEHMLFMGTAKYPDEDDYSQYLAQHGGYSNAYTDSEDTNYYFTVDSRYLEGALDRFAQFFIAPLLNPDGANREMHAVDSEHRKNLQNDAWRVFQMLKHMSAAWSPFHLFGTGDLQTLNKPGVREALVAFHAKYYSANLMRCVVLGKESLDELQALAVAKLTAVPNKGAKGPPVVANPFPPPFLGKRVDIEPVQSMQELQLYFPLRSVWDDFLTRPVSYVSHTLGYEGAGSLLSYLKEQHLADGVSTSMEIDARGFAVFVVEVSLTQTVGNNEEQLNKIVAAVFGFLNMLRERGNVSEQVWAETKALAEVGFRFKEKARPSDVASGLARRMQQVGPELLLNPPSAWEWSEAQVNGVLSQLVPSNMLMFFVSSAIPNATLTQTEPIYGTKYLASSLSSSTLAAWKSATPDASFHLPSPNPFVPTDFSVLPPPPSSVASNSTPQLVKNSDTDTERVWWLQDVMFRVPKVVMKVRMTNDVMYATAANAITTTLYLEAVSEALQEPAYDAGLAGFSYSISGQTALELTLSGYSDKFDQWAGTVAAAMVQPAVDADTFATWQHMLVQALENANDDQPYRVALNWLRVLVKSSKYNNSELLAAAKGATMQQLVDFIPQLRDRVAFETLVHGNVDSAGALKLAELVSSTIPHAPLPGAAGYCTAMGQIPEGSHVYQMATPNPDSVNSATIVSYQVGLRDLCNAQAMQGAREAEVGKPAPLVQECLDRSLAVDIISTIMQERAFDTLRTKQQLGYVVFGYSSARATCGSQGADPVFFWTDAVRSMHVLVQGANNTADDFDNRISDFLVEFAGTVSGMSDADWADVVGSLVVSKTEPPLTLGSLTSRVWGEIALHTYQFTRGEIEAARLPSITQADAAKLYSEYVVAGNGLSPAPKERRLSLELFAHGTARAAPTGAAAATTITDVDGFIASLQPFA